MILVWSNTCSFQLQAWHLIWSLRATAVGNSCDAFAMHYYCDPLISQLLSPSRSLILGLSTANGYSKGIQLTAIPWSCDFMIHACIKTSSNWGNKSDWGLWNKTQLKLNYQVGMESWTLTPTLTSTTGLQPYRVGGTQNDGLCATSRRN